MTPFLERIGRGVSIDELRTTLLRDTPVRDALGLELWRGSAYDLIPLGSLLPGLDKVGDPEPWMRDLGTRASNSLRTAKLLTWPQLAASSPSALRQLPNLGFKTFIEIIDVVLIAWAQEPPLPADELAHTDPQASALPTSPSPIADGDAEALAELLRWFWTNRGTRTFGEVLNDAGSCSPDQLPPRLREKAGLLAARRLAEALSLEEFGAQGWAWLLSFDERKLQILEHRVVARKRSTLDQLAANMGVTRERIRQIEGQLLEEVGSRLASDRAKGLHHLAARLRREATGLMSPEHFAGLLNGLALDSGAPRDNLDLCSGILARTAGDWPLWNGYIAPASLVEVLQQTLERWSAAGPCAKIAAADLDELLSAVAVTEPTAELLDDLGIRRINGVAVWWGRTHGDRGAAVLTAYDRVMRFAEIHAEIGSATSPRSLQNALLADKRIMRRGKESYGLRSWGGEEYSGLYDELEQAIERAGGRVPLASLVERFVEDFGVTAGSVLSFAADRRFIKHDDGTLAMRTAADPDVHYRHVPIEQTAGAYRLDGVWHACFEIDDDFARGSGKVIRRGIGQEAGLEPDLTFAVIFDGGTVTFTWGGSQPAIGSIRELISHHGCAVGDLLLLPLSGAEPRLTRVARLAERSGWSGVARVAAEMGLDPSEVDEEEQPLEVADALGLPPGADWHDIANRLRDRKDTRIVAFLPEHLR